MPYLILVDKPEGKTSFGAVAALRHKLNIKRIGHTGTLDPMATGVLPLLTGRASRLCGLMLESDKRYTATVRLGTLTDTLDITGTVLSVNPVNVSDEQLQGALKSFTKSYYQLPPMFSAIKKNGVRLYELARKGEEIEREKRLIEIKELTLLERINQTDFSVDVLCTKGTYIRSLAADIGEFLGCGATLVALRRTFAAGFSIDDCTPLQNIINDSTGSFLKSPELCVTHLKKIEVSEKQAARFKHGGELDIERIKPKIRLENGEKLRVKYGEEFLGIGEADLEKNQIKVSFVISE